MLQCQTGITSLTIPIYTGQLLAYKTNNKKEKRNLLELTSVPENLHYTDDTATLSSQHKNTHEKINNQTETASKIGVNIGNTKEMRECQVNKTS